MRAELAQLRGTSKGGRNAKTIAIERKSPEEANYFQRQCLIKETHYTENNILYSTIIDYININNSI